VQGVSPRAPRRLSGPSGAVALPAPRPWAPRRRRRGAAGSLPARALAGLLRGLRALPDHRLLDRLVRGRAWIGLVAFALLGIVALQLALLKLNTGIGRDLQRASALARRNAALQAQVSRLSAGDRIALQGQRLGLVMAPAGEARFLTTRGALDARAASRRVRSFRALALAGGTDSAADSSASSGSTGASSTGGVSGSRR
jgi:hypothetical protein